MSNILTPKFRIGQRIETLDANEQGVIKAMLYAEEMPSDKWKGSWKLPGFTYLIEFDTPRYFWDDAHETEIREI